MKQQILIILALSLILLTTTLTNSQLYYNINIEYKNSFLEIKNIDLIFSQQEFLITQGDYSLQLISFNNNPLTIINFTIPDTQVYDIIDKSGQIIDGGIETIDQTTFNLYIPYNPEAKQLIISNQNNQELTNISLIHLSTNQEATQIINNQKTIQQTQTNSEQTTQQQTTSKPESDTPWKIFLGFIIILTILILTILIKKKKR